MIVQGLKPNPQQKAIFDWVVTDTGSLVVDAKAGTAKTSTALMCLNFMQGDVYIGAYNKPIAEEIKRKVAKLQDLPCNVRVSTLHSAGLSAWAYGGSSRGMVELNKVPILLDEMAATDRDYITYDRFIIKLVAFAKRAGIGCNLNDEVIGIPDDGAWQALVDYYGIDDELPNEVWHKKINIDDLILGLIHKSQKLYRVSLEACDREIDFDDMLLAPIFFEREFPQYDWVILDEAQDCSAIRQEIAIRMMKSGGRMLVLGDARQNLYGFTGCLHDELDRLTTRLHAQTLPLTITYRCPTKVVRIAQRWVPDYQAREGAPDGTVRTVELEPGYCPECNGSGNVTDDRGNVRLGEPCPECEGGGRSGPGFWDEARGLGPESVVLCRNNKPLAELATRLMRKGIGCQIEGRNFGASMVNLCHRWRARDLDTLESRLMTYRQTESRRWRDRDNPDRAAAVEDRVDTLLSLLSDVRDAGKTRVSDLTARIQLMFGDTPDGQEPKVLVLSTVHKFKGRQARKVYILGRNKYMPSKFAHQPHELRAEENVEYVAVTRTLEELVDIVVPEGRRKE